VKLGIRQLAIKDSDSNSWYIKVDTILKSYKLPSAHEIILNPEKNWKKIAHDKIDETWINKWSEEARSKSNISTGPPSDELDKNIQRASHFLLLSH
jgi:hypothetical protein